MKKYEILLVDDELLILKTLSMSLKNRGYNVTTANNGEIAIEILKKKSFDLVITDLVMEPIGGMELLKEAKERYPEIIVVILTGYGDLKSAVEALRLKADDYLLKPCEEEEIYLRISNLLEKMELRKKVNIYEKILPICCVCKKIRDDEDKETGKGEWLNLETYMVKKAGLSLTHSYCNECKEKAMEEFKRELSQ